MESVLEYYEGLPPTSIIKGKNSSTHGSPCYARRGPIGIKTEIKVCKSVGPDNIPNKVLKEFAPALAIVIQDIYNQSLIESHIPHAVVKMFYHFPYTKRAPPPPHTHTINGNRSALDFTHVYIGESDARPVLQSQPPVFYNKQIRCAEQHTHVTI